VLSCAMIASLWLVFFPTAAAQASPEYQIKAVFLFNFAQFVEWPVRAFERPGQPIAICILGKDPFGAYLDEAVRDEVVGDRPLVVMRYRQVEDIGGACHLVFISRSEGRDIPEIIARLKGRSLLSVSDADAFAGRGGMVQFVTMNHRINLRINLEQARAAGLTISSKLLRRANIVATEEH
jgi:hypothetical protein